MWQWHRGVIAYLAEGLFTGLETSSLCSNTPQHSLIQSLHIRITDIFTENHFEEIKFTRIHKKNPSRYDVIFNKLCIYFKLKRKSVLRSHQRVSFSSCLKHFLVAGRVSQVCHVTKRTNGTSTFKRRDRRPTVDRGGLPRPLRLSQ